MNKSQAHKILSTVLLAGMILYAVVAGSPSAQKEAGSISASLVCDSTVTVEAIIQARGVSEEGIREMMMERGFTLAEICAMSPSQLGMFEGNEGEMQRPDQPDKAIELRTQQLQDENGFIPVDGYTNAKAHIEEMMAVPQPEGYAAGITNASWSWIGPGNIGGRVRSIVINPSDPNIMYAGSVSGGIWKTTDGAASWQIMDDFMANMAVATLVMDPTDPNTIYAGTGEGFYNADGIRGAGVFKTTNGGTTWTQIASTANSNWYYVNRLAISPTNNQVLLAATRSGIFRTADGGASWTQASTGEWYDVNFASDGSHAIASSSYGAGKYSTDGGSSWNTSTFSGLSSPGWGVRVEVALAPSDPSIVYASLNNNNGELWKSTDYGQNYSSVNIGNSLLSGQGWYDNIVWVDPTNANNVMVGGVDIYRSTDGGTTMTKVSQWWSAPNSAHADNHMIVEHPGFNGSTNKIVFVGNDGGVYKVDDFSTVALTSGWTELNNNLGITQFYGGAGSPLTGMIIGGAQDNGTLLYNPDTGTEGWAAVFGGDGGFSAIDPADPNYTYGEYIYGQINRSTTGSGMEYIWGKYWNGSIWTYKSAPYIIEEARYSEGNFIAPFILDPNDSNRLYMGLNSLWRSNDVKTPGGAYSATGPSWYIVKASVGSPISAIAVLEGNPDIVWVGHNNGDVYKTTNGTSSTPTWVKMDDGANALPNRYVTRITLDKTDTNKIYVTFGGFSADNVWMTTDNGSTWADRTGSGVTGLPDVPVRSLVIHPDYSSWIYVGTEVGVFASEDGGATWKLPHDGPTNTSVDELFWMNYTLVSVTHGRGMFKIAVQSPNTTLLPEMGVKGNNVNILDGDTTPNSTDHTNFGNADVSGAGIDRTFTIRNTGDTYLNLSGTPRINVTGANASDFTVTVDPSASVDPNATSNFTVHFAPSGLGVHTATISIDNNDADENPYNFDIQGFGTGTPSGWAWTLCAGEGQTCSLTGTQVVRYGANNTYYYGQFTNSVVCNTTSFGGDPVPNVLKSCYVAVPGAAALSISPTSWDFSSVDLGSSSTAKTFTVTNTGAANLVMGTLSISGNYALSNNTCDSVTVAASGTCTFDVVFTPTGIESQNGTVTIPSDASTSPDSVSLSGTGSAPLQLMWTLCAGEGQTCSFTGDHVVRYGANGTFYYGLFTDGVLCNNASFGGDPVPNVAKSCYIGEPDTVAPTTNFISTPPAYTNSSATFTFTGTDNVTPPASLTFQCAYDAVDWQACTSPWTINGLSQGEHTVWISSVDASGNWASSQAIHTWTVDTIAPNTTITVKPSALTTSKNASFSFTSTESGNFLCKLDGGAFASCTSPKAYTNLSVAKHTFQVYAVDAAGNIDASPATYTWTIQAERAKNGGFNTYTGTSKIPTNWVKSATFAATDGKDTKIKKEGTASVKIAGQAGKTKTLSQTLTLSGVTGDNLTLTFWARGSVIPAAGLCKAEVLLYSGNTLKQTKVINCSNGTYSTFQKKTLSFNAAANFTKVIIKFTYSKASGTVWFDGVSLMK